MTMMKKIDMQSFGLAEKKFLKNFFFTKNDLTYTLAMDG